MNSADAEFLSRFERLEIPGREFHHADHLRAAWLYLEPGDFASGAARFIAQFRRYVRHLGADAKYHETITWFYLAKIHERMQAAPAANWSDFEKLNPDLTDSSMALLKASYRPGTLDTPFARMVFVLPDNHVGAARESVTA